MNQNPCKHRMIGHFSMLFAFCLCVILFSPSAYASVQQKVNQWMVLYKGTSSSDFATLSSFILKHPDWPAQEAMQLEAEEKILESTPDSLLLPWFEKKGVITPRAMDRYLRILRSQGNEEKMRLVLNDWWKKADLTREQQQRFYQSYSSLFTRQAHAARLDWLLYENKAGNARAIAGLLGKGYPALAEARLALKNQSGNVDTLVAGVPSDLQSDPGLIFERIRYRRKKDITDGAIALLGKTPTWDKLHDPEEWWKDRHILARRLIEQGQYKRAYQVVGSYQPKEGLHLAEGEWLAGWLALQFNKDPARGFMHFERMYKGVDTPISKGRAAYWAGRASDAMGYPDTGRKWYSVAAKYNTTFYGQLAEAVLQKNPTFQARSYARVSSSDQASYEARDIAQAAKILKSAGNRSEAGLFLSAMRNNAKSANELQMAARFAKNLGFPELGIKAAQEAQKKYDVTFIDLLYPTITEDVSNVHDVEWAVIHAIIRQESRFEKGAVSEAGARGLMQVMPGTAKTVAKKLGMAHQTDWLTSRAAHNIKLGTRYIADLIDNYGGNYAIAFAGYNAGPGRASEWLRENGDPRKGAVDFVTWIELIPFSETRNYVQRVLEGVYVYRGILKDVQKPVSNPIHIAYNAVNASDPRATTSRPTNRQAE